MELKKIILLQLENRMGEKQTCQKNKGRTILLSTEINDESAMMVVDAFLQLQSEDPLKDITMIINSPGGEISSMFAITDMMDMLSCDIRTIVLGMAASAASFIATCGTPGKRFISKNSKIMVHSVSGGAIGVIHDINIAVDEIKSLQEQMLEEYVKRTKIGKAEIKSLLERDRYLKPEEAIEMGLVDGIIKSLY